MQWLIDIIKEWIITQGYATIVYVDAEIAALKAYFEAKLYLQKAEYPGYGMPIHVTGNPDPDVTCTYFRCGDLNGKPCYSQEDGSYFIFWVPGFWFIGTVLGGAPPSHLFRRDDPSVFGDYFNILPSTGGVTAASGYKYLLTSYVHRGDPAAYDYILANFTRDGAWHDLDLSAIVPEGAVAIDISMQAAATLLNQYVLLRKKTNANDFNSCRLLSVLSNILNTGDFCCACDDDRVIQYKFIGPLWTSANFVVKGWWL